MKTEQNTNTEANIAKLATAKAVAEKELKLVIGEVAPGDYPVDVTVRIVGGLKKGAPYRQRVAAAANPWRLLGLALSKLNASSVEALVREAVEAPLEAVDDEAIKQRAKDAIETMVAATEREIEGRITAAVRWELLS